MPSKGPFFPFHSKKLEILQQWINSILSVGRIQKSSSPYNLPIIFVEKKDKNNLLRLVINYYRLNKIIILVRYPISLINEF